MSYPETPQCPVCPDIQECPDTKFEEKTCPDVKDCPETKCPEKKCPETKCPEVSCPKLKCQECPDCKSFSVNDTTSVLTHANTKPLSVSINEDSFIVGLMYEDEVYLPWSWIQPYFDVYGNLDRKNDIFHFKYSYRYAFSCFLNKYKNFSGVTYFGNETYTPKGGFMNFDTYTVESRRRVKLIDGVHGVPISTQVP